MKKGDIFYADLSPVIGSEQDGIRPVVILQNDIGNKYSRTVIIAPITTKTKASIPTHVFISSVESDLPKDSIILVEQLRTIDKSRFIKKVGHLSDKVMSKINRALKINFNIRGDIYNLYDFI